MSYVGEDFDKKVFDVQALYNKLYGYVGLPFPVGISEDVLSPNNPTGLVTEYLDQFKTTPLGVTLLMPLVIQIPGGFEWKLDVPVLLNVSGKNKVIRRYPSNATSGGSIKERWGSDDYSVSIKGVLINWDGDAYPTASVTNLKRVCSHKNAVLVKNDLFLLFGIKRMAITSWDLPHTQGEGMQAFTIKGYSDELFDGLLTDV